MADRALGVPSGRTRCDDWFHTLRRLFFWAASEGDDARTGITSDPTNGAPRRDAGEPVCVAKLVSGRRSRRHARTSALHAGVASLTFSYRRGGLHLRKSPPIYPLELQKSQKKVSQLLGLALPGDEPREDS